MRARVAKLRTAGLSKSRRGPQGDTAILQDVSLRVEAGELLALVGPSGGGKSTLVRLLNRLEEPTAGGIFLDGRSVADLDPVLLRRRIALVLQKPFMFDETVLENLQRPFRYTEQPLPGADSEVVRNCLRDCQLPPDLLSHAARLLSVGQQQRVNLARALVGGPEVLVLDEPTSALDRPTADALALTLRTICRSRGVAVLLVTHDLQLVERCADRCAYLEQGRICEEGAVPEIFKHPKSMPLQRFLHRPQGEREGY